MPTTRSARITIGMAADLAGADVGQAALAISNPLRGQALAVPPEVWLGDTPEGEPALLWTIPEGIDRYGIARDWRSGGCPEAAFWAFLDLAGTLEPVAYLTFAQRFGTLGLWPYETPARTKEYGLDYWVPSVTLGISTPWRYAATTSETLDEYHRLEAVGRHSARYEPIAEWRRWASWTRAIVEIAFALRQQRPGTRQQWAALELDGYFESALADLWRPSRGNFAFNIEWQRELLTDVIQQRYLRWSGLVPAIAWAGDELAVSLRLGGWDAVRERRTSGQLDWPEQTLFPALAAQLLAVVTAGRPVAACSRCGRVHPRTRRARHDQPAYCDTCRREAARRRKREHAARRRARERDTAHSRS